jgi:hypothetical protein
MSPRPSVIISFESEEELIIYIQEMLAEGHFDNLKRFKFLNVSKDLRLEYDK